MSVDGLKFWQTSVYTYIDVTEEFERLKANVSQENQVLCHVLRQFSNVLL